MALGDPVFNLRVRDQRIGWNAKDRGKRLVNILDAYVLGAVPPYSFLLGGKLIACLVRTKEVRDDFAEKYGDTRGIISRRKKAARLLMVTTSSSLGRSSIYNRLKLGGQPYLQPIGYAELAGRYLTDILKAALVLLDNCEGRCDRSCETCLRHYHNQHLRDRFDRHVGAQLLRYALDGTIPAEYSADMQAAALSPLNRLLELDGFKCTEVTNVAGVQVPVSIEKGGKQVSIGLKSGLLDGTWDKHTLEALAKRGRTVRVLNEFILRRNLPDEHQLIRELF